MAEISRKDLKKKINSEEFGAMYLLYGDEKMYVKTDTEHLVLKLMGKNPPEFNFHSFKDNYTLDDVAVAVQVVPFICEHNCVLISDLDVNQLKKSEFEQLMEILENTPDTTVVIFTMPTLVTDSKKPGANLTKLVNFVKKQGFVCNMAQETDLSLARQIIKWADKREIKIEQADAYKLQEYVGNDLNAIKNELDKLCNYVGDGGLITGEHIEMLTAKRLEANIYQLTDAVIRGDGTKAFEILDVLFYQKADPNLIISVIGTAYTDFYIARIATECGVSLTQIASEFGYGRREFVLKKAVTACKKVSTDSLRKSLGAITEVSAKLKSVRANKRIMVEKLVAQLMMYSQRGEA